MIVDSQTRNNSQDSEQLQNSAIALHKAGDSLAAVESYLKAISLQSEPPAWVYCNAITLLSQLDRLEEGLKLGREALKIYRQSASLYQAIAIIYEYKEDSLNCIQYYQRAIALDPQQPDWVYCNLTKHLLATEQYDLAVETGTQGVELYDNFHPLYYAFGNALAASQQWEQAILAYQRVQELKPSWQEAGQKLNQAIYQKSRQYRLENKVDNQVEPAAITKQVDTAVSLDINSLFAHLQQQQLYVESCQQLWQKIQDKQTLDFGCWLSPSIIYLEMAVNNNCLLNEVSLLACSDYKYAITTASCWQIARKKYAIIACFANNIYIEEYESYRLGINAHNTLLLAEQSVENKHDNLELIEHLQTKSNQQKNSIREGICRHLIAHSSTTNRQQAQALIHKLQYFIDVPQTNFVEPNLPFKIFIDHSIALKSEGLFISGWLHDPYQMLEKITAVSALGFSLELNQADIHRLPRQDVKAYLQNTRYGNSEDKLGFCGYLKVPLDIQNAIANLADLHSFRFLVSLKGNLEIEVGAEIEQLDCYQARQRVLQLVNPAQASEAMLADCLAPVCLRLQQLCIEQVKVKETITFGKPVSQPLVSIIIPLYRRLDFLKVQLATMALDPAIKQCELIYVLDSPEQADEVKALLPEYSALYRLGITLVVMQHNSGYAAANNAGASVAKGKYLVLLNSDVFAKTKGWMIEMAKFYAQSPQIGTLGAKLIYEDDSLQHAGMFFAKTAFPFWITLHYHKGLPITYGAAQTTKAVPTVTGACLMISKQLYEQVGGLTTDYIIGDFEDSDLCLKCRELGYESWYFADAALYHLERQSVPLNSTYSGSLAWQLNARLHHQRWEKQISQLMSQTIF